MKAMHTTRFVRNVSAAALVALLAGGTLRANADDFTLDGAQAQEYADCMTLARRVPNDGYQSAMAWQLKGGGEPARHCAAVALIGLGRDKEAAGQLEKLGTDMSKDRPDLAGELFAQAGQAWTMAGDLKRALTAQTTGLTFAPSDVDLLVDRAVTQAGLNDYKKSIEDLDKAQGIAPDRADVLTYRASAWRFLNDLVKARADADAALTLDPKDPYALLERGNIRRLTSDLEGARQDWTQVVALAGGTPAGDAAAANLKKLDTAPTAPASSPPPPAAAPEAPPATAPASGGSP
jgi:tetratricopeptide (TPR) repeat protein